MRFCFLRNKQDAEEGFSATLLGTLPAKVSAEEEYFQAIGPVLACFLKFLGSTDRLKNADKMASRIFALSQDIVDASNDPMNWGMAKSVVMSAMEAGVDVTNEAEFSEFMEQYNSRKFGMGYDIPAIDPLGLSADDFETYREPYERLGPKIGRNDPCPCGSGKKYKKCCGG